MKLKRPFQIAIVVFIYFISARLSLLLAFQDTNVSPVWPPSGLAFAMVLFWGVRIWPGILIGAFLANYVVFMVNRFAAVPEVVMLSFLISVGNTLEAVTGAYLFKRLINQDTPLSRTRNVFVFFCIALGMCLVSAFNGPTWLCLFGHVPWNLYPFIFITWWIGDATGVLTVMPILWAMFSMYDPFHKKPSLFVEFLGFALVLFIMNVFFFSGQTNLSRMHLPLAFMLYPFVILGSSRFRHSGTAITILITVGFSVWGTIHRFGPFGHLPQNEALILIQALIGMIAVTGMVITATLEERDRFVRELEKSQKRFERTVEASPHGIIVISQSGIIEMSNKMTEQMFQYSRREFMGKSIDVLFPEPARFSCDINRKDFGASTQTRLMEAGRDIHALRKDGTQFPVEISFNSIELEGEPYVLVSILDISERKKAEIILKESEAHFRSMADNAPVMIWMSGRDGKCIFFNQSWLQFTGRTMQQELGEGWSEGVHPDDLSRCLKIYSSAFLERRKFTMDYRLKRADGFYRTIMDTGIPFYNIDASFAGYIGSCVDITPLKEAQEVLSRDKETLKRIVDERSWQLMQTQKKLEQSNRLAGIGTLAATVAHELRNPLGVIQMAGYNLKRKNKTLEKDKHLLNIEKKICESNQIINNLLNYSCIKEPKYELLDLRGILNECIQSAESRFTKNEIQVNVHYPPDDNLLLEADLYQMKEVFYNLLANAYQSFENKNAGKVDVHVSSVNDQIQIMIKDTGMGIDPKDIQRIFEPFFTRKSKGTGLGLAICNEFVKLHNGTIHVESKVNQGSTVFVTLPREKGIS